MSTAPEQQSVSPSPPRPLDLVAGCDELGSTTEFAGSTTELTPDCPPSIGPYTITGHLASGGQADVFLSAHPRLLVPVVVKWLRRQGPSAEVGGARLIREGQVLANLPSHPNLVRIYDLGLHQGRPFLVLEHVQGHTLAQPGLGERPLPGRAAELVAALADAVHKAHEQGVTHQDITPGNVIVDGHGQPRLIDFGLAWFRPPWTLSADVERPDAGTPRFLAPEQADPGISPVDRRTDVFGLGALLYHLLTGRVLYDGMTQSEILRQAAEGAYDTTALDRPGVPKRLAAVCRKALARNSQDRYRTAAELAGALRASIRPPQWYRAAGLAALMLVLFLAASVGWLASQFTRHGQHSPFSPGSPDLTVFVWRPRTEYTPLSEALPVRTGDELQVRFRVPAGLHVGLFSVNGRGQLVLLEAYLPRDAPTELVYPASAQSRTLEPPPGTEVLLVCGRPADPVRAAEVRDAWGDALPLPAVDPRRLLRLRASHVKDEDELPRDFDATQDRPEPDAVVRRLGELRERLTPAYPFFEGLAFRHE